MSRISQSLQRLKQVHDYTRELLLTIPVDQFYYMPILGTSHVAWQVGHLAMAEYRLCLERWRGRQAEDDAFMPLVFMNQFIRESVPAPDGLSSYDPNVLYTVYETVHQKVLEEVATFDENDWDKEITVPHKHCKTRGECLDWASYHTMLHAGQIGLLRRMLGLPPIW